MTQEVIDIGAAPNDGLGDPLRTAFAKTNNNFSQLFASGGVSGISNGSSNVNIPQVNGNVVISSAGTANVLTVTGTGVNVAGTLNSTGLATLSNLSVTGAVVSTGTIQSLADVTAVTVTASGNLSANNAVITGNISADFYSGNGAGLTGVIATGNVGAATQLTNGTTTMNIPVANGNMIGNVGGVLNIFTLSTGGLAIAGIVSVSGNITGGNLRTGGLVSSTGNVTGGNLLTGGLISATGNITGGNANITGTTSTTSKTTGALVVGGGVGVAGDVWAGNSITVDGGSYGNVVTTQFASVFATGSGPNPRSIMQVRGADGVTGIGMQAYSGINGQIYANTGITFTTGSTLRDKDYPTGGTTRATLDSTGLLVTGLVSASGNITGGNITLDTAAGNIYGHDVSATGGVYTSGVVSATGNVRGGNINTVGLVTATGNVIAGNLVTGGLISAAGNITSGNLSVGTGTVTVGNIVNSNGNAVGNIGSSSNYFNQVFAQASTALYADLAEVYSADAEYSPGTVVSFGGDQEVTRSVVEGDNRVAGVISENPSYLMNSGLEAQHRAAVALTGRVPTLVIGPVAKGDMMISAGNGWARACATPAMGTVIGKALKNFDGDSGIIEIVVGRQ